MPTQPDRIDDLVGQWRGERPDLDLETMATVGRVLAVAQRWLAAIEEHAREHGIDRGQGDVLFTLRRSGEPYRLSPSRLAASTLVSSGTMTNRLDRLERLGLVTRLANPGDRRGMDVALTAEGLALADEAVSRHVAREQEMLAPLSAREREQLDRLFRKLL
ncbi:MAG: MarR family winged helix-turn-helix transcriptional regulator [Solirubrobacteraceae bacterium]